jgi:hypothetical protein
MTVALYDPSWDDEVYTSTQWAEDILRDADRGLDDYLDGYDYPFEDDLPDFPNEIDWADEFAQETEL